MDMCKRKLLRNHGSASVSQENFAGHLSQPTTNI